MPRDVTNLAGTGGITVARLKFGKNTAPSLYTGMTAAEKNLSDIVDIRSGVQDRAQKTRKLDAYLRVFQSALNYFNGTSSPKALQSFIQPVEVEFVKLENPYLKKIDTSA